MKDSPLAYFLGRDEERLIPIDNVISELGQSGPKTMLEDVMDSLERGATDILLVRGW
jgi:hypothetical protein